MPHTGLEAACTPQAQNTLSTSSLFATKLESEVFTWLSYLTSEQILQSHLAEVMGAAKPVSNKGSALLFRCLGLPRMLRCLCDQGSVGCPSLEAQALLCRDPSAFTHRGHGLERICFQLYARKVRLEEKGLIAVSSWT